MQRARIKLWGRDPKQIDELAREIRKIAEKVFSLDSVGEKLGNLLDEVSRS